jgi:hypothetical protein
VKPEANHPVETSVIRANAGFHLLLQASEIKMDSGGMTADALPRRLAL